jgi:hypothetical protein
MPAQTAKRSTSRGRESTQSARRTSNSRSSSQRRTTERKGSNGARSKSSAAARSKSGNAARSKASNGARSKSSNAARSKASNAARSKATNGARSQSNSQQDHVGREALTAVIGATVGVAGGVLLGRKALARERKVLGVPLPNKIDLSGVGQQIGEAGRQFGRLAGEVRGVREKAEQIGRALS